MSGDRLRSPEDIGATGAAWVTELELAALVEIAEAARETGWKDLNGLCWCEQSQELTEKPHRPQCQRMRDALARLDSGATE